PTVARRAAHNRSRNRCRRPRRCGRFPFALRAQPFSPNILYPNSTTSDRATTGERRGVSPTWFSGHPLRAHAATHARSIRRLTRTMSALSVAPAAIALQFANRSGGSRLNRVELLSASVRRKRLHNDSSLCQLLTREPQ